MKSEVMHKGCLRAYSRNLTSGTWGRLLGSVAEKPWLPRPGASARGGHWKWAQQSSSRSFHSLRLVQGRRWRSIHWAVPLAESRSGLKTALHTSLHLPYRPCRYP